MNDGAGEVLQFMTATGQLTLELSRSMIEGIGSLSAFVSRLVEANACTGQVHMDKLAARFGIENLRHHCLDAQGLRTFQEQARRLQLPYALLAGDDKLVVAIHKDHEDAFGAALELSGARRVFRAEAMAVRDRATEPPVLEEFLENAQQPDAPFAATTVPPPDLQRLRQILRGKGIPDHLYVHGSDLSRNELDGTGRRGRSLLLFPSALLSEFGAALRECGLRPVPPVHLPKMGVTLRESMEHRLQRINHAKHQPPIEHLQIQDLRLHKARKFLDLLAERNIPFACAPGVPGFMDVLIAAGDAGAAQACLAEVGIRRPFTPVPSRMLKKLWQERCPEQVARLDTRAAQALSKGTRTRTHPGEER